MKTSRFRLLTGDRNAGDVFLPDDADGKLPVVVYCHGWGGNRLPGGSTRAVLDRAVRAGMAFVTFDFFGCGETGGSYSEMSYGRWTANLRDVVEWVALQRWADPAKVGCFGISSGTTPALRLAETDRTLAFVISVATCLGLFINMPNGPARVLVESWDTLASGGSAEVFRIPFTLEFFRDFIGSAPVYGLESISCPVYFLQGELDNPYRRADAWTGYQVMKRRGLPVAYQEIPGAGHGLDEAPERCADEVLGWLARIGIVGDGRAQSRPGATTA